MCSHAHAWRLQRTCLFRASFLLLPPHGASNGLMIILRVRVHPRIFAVALCADLSLGQGGANSPPCARLFGGKASVGRPCNLHSNEHGQVTYSPTVRCTLSFAAYTQSTAGISVLSCAVRKYVCRAERPSVGRCWCGTHVRGRRFGSCLLQPPPSPPFYILPLPLSACFLFFSPQKNSKNC